MRIEHKTYEAEVKGFDDEKLWIDHFISTEKRDRGGDILKADGMEIQGKVVVLHSHGYGPMGSEPIAKNLSLKPGDFKGKPGIVARTQFYDGAHLNPPDNTGRRLYEKTKTGIMPNWSVGWRPLQEEYVTERNGERTRVVSRWELLEYSIVAVPMQADAQTLPPGKEADAIQFKVFSELEEKRGELVAWRNGLEDPWEEKPYPNEHACRLEDPGKYIRIRRENDALGAGVHAIWGVQGGDKPVELQAIRLSLTKFTAAQARAWLKSHDRTCKVFEPATGKCLGSIRCPPNRFPWHTTSAWPPLRDTFLKIDAEILGDALPGKILGKEEKPKEDSPPAMVPQEYIDLINEVAKWQSLLIGRLDSVEAEIDALKVAVQPEPAPKPSKEKVSAKPPELVFREEGPAPEATDNEKAAAQAILNVAKEVVGDHVQAAIDKMKGKIR